MPPSRALARVCLRSSPNFSSRSFHPSLLLRIRLHPLSIASPRLSLTAYNGRCAGNLMHDIRRAYSSAAVQGVDPVKPPDFLDEKELAIFDQLKEELNPTELEVQDVSGGCGSMYAVAVTSEKFRGLPMIKQHRLVNEILKEKIKDWHGMQLRTKVP
ncbi:bola-like protein [Microthyrium microscopicum]|uniref:Bola-like protein n=1 Tax=Microthyrium microscopicum TaxID=703497 RepID=A0A6A6UTE4_9PEZI|nr:bola-like protein [Microthyrium microscopicum]